MTWSGATLGLTLHSLVGGVALAASVAHESGEVAFAGLSTFVVIFLHKPFDSLTIGTLMASEGWPAQIRHVVNGLFALAIPLGVLAFHVTVLRNAATDSPALPYALAFSAGTFLCIAMSDILPELQFHSHDRVKLSLALLAGLALAWIVAFVETGHQHG
jgi:zinc and cadmium transporter